MINKLNERNRQILKLIIDSYVSTGEPTGSKLISQRDDVNLSSATIRNVMSQLEDLGLLYSPHRSSGRIPTDVGMTVFVESLMEINDIESSDRYKIENEIQKLKGNSLDNILESTSGILSGISSCAGVVFATKEESSIKQVEFISISEKKALAVIVLNSGSVENRMVDIPLGVTASALQEASNYINSRIINKTLKESILQISKELEEDKVQLDELTSKVVKSGIASFSPNKDGGHLFIKGQANLLEDITALEDIEKIRNLFLDLDTKETMINLLESTTLAEGLKIFIGAENRLFNHSGCSMIMSSYKNEDSKVIGAIGVIGPSRINYRRIIPVINYTSQIVSNIIQGKA